MSISFKTILMTTDLSELSWAAMEPALYFAGLTGAQVIVLTVIKAPAKVPSATPGPSSSSEGMGHPSREERFDMARRMVEANLRSLPTEVSIRVEVTEAEDPSAEIVHQVDNLHADLVVIATRGHDAPSRFHLGSTTERVVRKSSVPVLSVHPEASTLS